MFLSSIYLWRTVWIWQLSVLVYDIAGTSNSDYIFFSHITFFSVHQIGIFFQIVQKTSRYFYKILFLIDYKHKTSMWWNLTNNKNIEAKLLFQKKMTQECTSVIWKARMAVKHNFYYSIRLNEIHMHMYLSPIKFGRNKPIKKNPCMNWMEDSLGHTFEISYHFFFVNINSILTIKTWPFKKSVGTLKLFAQSNRHRHKQRFDFHINLLKDAFVCELPKYDHIKK